MLQHAIIDSAEYRFGNCKKPNKRNLILTVKPVQTRDHSPNCYYVTTIKWSWSEMRF